MRLNVEIFKSISLGLKNCMQDSGEKVTALLVMPDV